MVNTESNAKGENIYRTLILRIVSDPRNSQVHGRTETEQHNIRANREDAKQMRNAKLRTG